MEYKNQYMIGEENNYNHKSLMEYIYIEFTLSVPSMMTRIR